MTYDEIVSSIRATMSSYWAKVVQMTNTIVDDLMVKSQATMFDIFYRELEYYWYTSTLTGFSQIIDDDVYKQSLIAVFGYDTIDEVNARISADLDNYVASFGIQPRLKGTKSTVTETLFFSSADPVTITAGAQYYVPSNVPVFFELIATLSGTPVSVGGGLYALYADCRALVAGTAGNVPSNTITAYSAGTTGLTAVVNENESVDGTNDETDAQLIARAQEWLQGFSLDTKGGVRAKLIENGVRDAYVVTPTDVRRVRSPGVDVWAISRDYVTVIEDFEWTVETRDLGYIPVNQPLNGSSATFILAGYSDAVISVLKDSPSEPYGLSKYSRDRVQFAFPTTFPTLGDTVTLTYQYNIQMAVLEELFQDPNPELFADILIKEAVEKPITTTFRVKLFPDANPDVVGPLIKNDIKAAVDAKVLGGYFDQSDLIIIIGDRPEVDKVVVDIFDYVGSTGVQTTLSAEFNEYLTVLMDNIILSFELV